MNCELQKARLRKGLTRAALARAARFSAHTIRALEEGHGDLSSVRYLLSFFKLRLSHDPVALGKLRRERGMPINVLARRIGVSRQTLSALESGRCGNLATVLAVADALNVRLRLVPDRRGVPTWSTPTHILDALYSVTFDLDPCSPDPPTLSRIFHRGR